MNEITIACYHQKKNEYRQVRYNSNLMIFLTYAIKLKRYIQIYKLFRSVQKLMLFDKFMNFLGKNMYIKNIISNFIYLFIYL